MKKLLTGFLVAVFAFVAFATTGQVNAQDELIDLYPNNDIAQLQGQHGNSNWKLEFHGRRYHTVSFMAKFASQFNGIEDLDKETFVGADLVPNSTANAMGGFIHNDTERTVVLDDGDRTRLTGGAINRVWVVFDEEGRLKLFEDHVGVYYITPVEDEDYYRLATEEEIAAFDPDAEDQTVLHTHIRMLLDEDGEGYKIEPIGYLAWTHATYAPEGEDEEGNTIPQTGVPSVLLPEERNPNHVVLGPGHTALHLSTWDRNNAVIYADWGMTFPEVMADLDTEERMELVYDAPAPLFLGLEGLDKDLVAPGVNIVVEYGTEPTPALFTNGVHAIFKDEEQSIDGDWTLTGNHDKVDYAVTIFNDENEEVDTFDMIWNETENAYVPSKTTLDIDSTAFGAKLRAEYTSTSPAEKTVTREASIDVGVLPININGVTNKTIDQGMYIDFLEGLTADDAYGNDVTSSLTVDPIPGFNRYSAQIGSYQVTVRASYLFEQDVTGSEVKFTFEGADYVFPEEKVNGVFAAPYTSLDLRAPAILYGTDNVEAHFSGIKEYTGALYHFNAILLDANSNIIAFYTTNSGNVKLNQGSDTAVAITGVSTQAARNEWLDSLTIDESMTFMYYGDNNANVNAFTALTKKLNVEENPVRIVDLSGVPYRQEINAERTFTLNVRDIQSPEIRALQDTFVVYTDNNYASTEEAVFSNVVATDNAGAPTLSASGLSRIYLDEVGEHEITVVATDAAGNSTDVTFTLKIVDRALPEDLVNEVDDLTDQLEEANSKNTELEGKVSDLEQALADQTAELQEAIDGKSEGTSLVVTIIIAVVTAGLSFGGAVLLLRKP